MKKQRARNGRGPIPNWRVEPAPGFVVPDEKAFVDLHARIIDLATPEEDRVWLMVEGAPCIRGIPRSGAIMANLLAGLLVGIGEPELAAHFTAEAWRLDPKNGGCRARARKTRSRPI